MINKFLVEFDEDTSYHLIKAISPDILSKYHVYNFKTVVEHTTFHLMENRV
tara:strand:- start:393 stop:545 length:153 start_codon:yes stop_codon:yes gene_type:complete